MIDWANLAANALWILGCALALATLSYASWQASLSKDKMRSRLERPSFQSALFLAGLLFCLGMTFTSQKGYVIAVWGILSLLLLILSVLALRRARKVGEETT